MGREGLCLTVASLALLAASAPASAATVTVSGRTVTYTAAPGEHNDLEVVLADGRVTLQDDVPIAAGTGCAAFPPIGVARRAVCKVSDYGRRLTLQLADGDDSARLRPEVFPPGQTIEAARIEGGAGNDTLETFQDVFGPVTLRGGTGDDYIRAAGPRIVAGGDSGNDVIFARAVWVAGQVTQAASLSGGGGDDIVAVHPSPGIGAHLRSDERISGGRGNDLLFGDDGTDVLRGDSGKDRLGGFSRGVLHRKLARSTNAAARASTAFDRKRTYLERGGDALLGGSGADRLSGGPGGDVLVGGSGNDAMLGGPDADLLSGQDGRDLLRGGDGKDAAYGGKGADTFAGGRGWDTLIGADDKERDEVADCGPGRQDRFVAGVRDVAKRVAMTRTFRVTALTAPGQLPPLGYTVPRGVMSSIGFAAVGAPIRGCERLALAPLSVIPKPAPAPPRAPE